MTNYELDPAWYYTAPGLAWDAALKMTKVELELLTDMRCLTWLRKEFEAAFQALSIDMQRQTTRTWEKTLTLRTLVST